MLPTPPPSPSFNECLDGQYRIGQLLFDRIQLVEVLGSGAYGVVYKAVDIHSGTYYAVKALTKLGLDSRQRAFQQREVRLHSEVSSHPNIVSVLDILESSDCTFVILEYCPAGDLFSNITEKGYAGNDFMTRNAFLQILDAVEHCHSRGIFHRDLKPENVLVTNGGMTVKLADFGLATKEVYSSDFGCGSTFYMSPECQDPAPKPFSCYASGPNDVWALGVMLVNLTCGRNPWKRATPEDPTFSAYLRDRQSLKSILPISSELGFILRRIFDLNPSRRPSIPELRGLISQCSSFAAPRNAAVIPQSTPPPAPSQAYAPPPSRLIIPEPQQFSLSSEAECSPLYEYQTAATLQQPYFYQYPISYTTSPVHSHAPSPTSFSYAPSPASTAPSSPASAFFPSHQHFEDSISRQPSPPASYHAQQQQQQHHQSQLPSPPLPSNSRPATAFIPQFQTGAWYSNFMPALDLAQKHMSFGPMLGAVRFV